jgi:uncharacterized protein YjbI with pentapeptide repeats
MRARFRSLWQKHKLLLIIIVITSIILLLLFILAVVWFGWNWTGFNGGYPKITTTSTISNVETLEQAPARTLWDWLGLLAVLAVPVVVAFGAARFTANQAQVSEAANTDNQRATALQIYFDKMSELILDKNLRKSHTNDDVVDIARARTLTMLSLLDGQRKSSIIQFLEESHLIELINLSGADLSGANLVGTNLGKANLSGADLRNTDLTYANLAGTELSFANLGRANLSEANLRMANLTASNLSFAILRGTKLIEAKLMGTEMKNADLHFANLTNADLSKATISFPFAAGVPTDVSGAKFKDADLTSADFSGAKLAESDQLEVAKSLHETIMPDGSKHS